MFQQIREVSLQQLARDSSMNIKTLSFLTLWRNLSRKNGHQAPEFSQCHHILPWTIQPAISSYQTWRLTHQALFSRSTATSLKSFLSSKMSTAPSTSNTTSQLTQNSSKTSAVAPSKWSTYRQSSPAVPKWSTMKIIRKLIKSIWMLLSLKLIILASLLMAGILLILLVGSLILILSISKLMLWHNFLILWSKPSKIQSTQTWTLRKTLISSKSMVSKLITCL